MCIHDPENDDPDACTQVIQMMPAPGWRVKFDESKVRINSVSGDDPTGDEPLIGWGLLCNGLVVGLAHESDGVADSVTTAFGTGVKYRVYPNG